MEFVGTEVSIGRVVFIISSDSRIFEKNTAAAIGLESVFMGINDNGIDFFDMLESRERFWRKVIHQDKITTVGCVSMNAEFMLGLKFENLRKWIYGA